jgi:hypothetical protein
MPDEHAYPLPKMTLPGDSVATLLERLRRFENLCSAHGVDPRNTRIDRYHRYLEASPWQDGGLDKGIFLDPPDSPIQHSLDRLLYVLREVHELTWIGEGLRGTNTRGLADKLEVIVRGADFAASDRNAESRNTQFELRIASYFGRRRYRLDLSTLTDIVATRGLTTYYIECKRVASAAQLVKRIKEGLRQVEERKPKSGFFRKRHGVVAADVTRVAFTRNGLTMGGTPDHARDIVREELRRINAHLHSRGPSMDGRDVVGLWLQIHIPALVLNPPTPITIFSSHYLENPKPLAKSRYALPVLKANAIAATVSESGDEAPRPLIIRESISVPAGTRLQFDDEVFETLVATGALPERPDDHVVVTVWPPRAADDEPEEFSYFELQSVLANVDADERGGLTGSLEGAACICTTTPTEVPVRRACDLAGRGRRAARVPSSEDLDRSDREG